MSNEKRHPIQVVARRTGLTADVLRAWERRYGAVEPMRSPSGRRLYSDDDIERLRLLKRATEVGRSIGQVASLATERVAAIVRDDEAQEAEAPRRTPERLPDAQTHEYLDRARAAVSALDAPELKRVLAQAAAGLGTAGFVEQVVGPLLEEIGENWSTGRVTVAHEHLASTVIRLVLGEIVVVSGERDGAPGIVVTTPAGERHEFGALMVAAVAASAGWRVIYLGPDTPMDSVVAAVSRHAPRVVAMSVVRPIDGADATREIAGLRDRLPRDVTLVVGGRGLVSGTELDGVVRATDLQAFRALLSRAAGSS